MNWHQVIDRRSVEMHGVIAEILKRSPERLGEVSAWIERMLAKPDLSDQTKDSLEEWKQVVVIGGVGDVVSILEDPGEEGQRMRQSTPFAILMPQDKRLEILEKYESLRSRTSPAGS
jgi:hypothetical protein